MVKFRLEPLLKYRKLQEDILEKTLAGTRRQLGAAEENRADCRRRRADAARELQYRQTREGGLSGAASEVYSVYLSQLENDIRRQKEQIEKIRQQVEQERCQLLEAVKKRKMLDRLKEKQQQQTIEAVQRSERHFFDDVATNTFIRKSSTYE